MTTKTKYEYRSISRRAKDLLNRCEDYDVEFKESRATLEAEDLVAFANSEEGGAVLVGIREIKKGKDKGKGEIIGCKTGDKEKLAISNTAESCSPPLNIELYIENTNRRSFYRIEIRGNRNKPYCTLSGTYKIRGDGHKKALLPSRLLSMFVAMESGQFISKYREASKELSQGITDTLDTIKRTSDELMDKMLGVSEAAEVAAAHSEETFSAIESTISSLEELDSKINMFDILEDTIPNIEKKVNAIIRALKIEPQYSRLLALVSDLIKQSVPLLGTGDKRRDEQIIEYIKSELSWIPEEDLDKTIETELESYQKLKKEIGRRDKPRKAKVSRE